jgi:2-oxoglutarate-dependent dioxygenase
MTTAAPARQVDIRYLPSPEQIGTYQREGWALLPGLIDPATAQALRDEVMGIMDIIGLPVTALKQTNEYLAGSALDALINGPRLREVASALLGVQARRYLPFTAVKSPGGGKFSFHQDNQYTRHDGPSINLWFALQPMGEAEGCLRMLPRSHRDGTLESVEAEGGHRRVRIEPTQFTPVIMQPGDCCAFTRLTVHGSGANTSSAPRVGYACQFHGYDTRWLDNGEWKLLRDHPRFKVDPVAEITRPKGKVDGH